MENLFFSSSYYYFFVSYQSYIDPSFSFLVLIHICLCVRTLYKKSHSRCHPFSSWRYTILFNTHHFSRFLLFLLFLIYRTDEIHYAIVEYVAKFASAPSFILMCLALFLVFVISKEPKRNWKNSLTSVICTRCNACIVSERVTELVRRKWSITLITSPKERASSEKEKKKMNREREWKSVCVCVQKAAAVATATSADVKPST